MQFDPGAKTALALDVDRIAEVRISAKAVVTASDLDRSVGAQRLSVVDDVVRGMLRNDGVAEVTVPHVFVTLRDDDGQVGWVADGFVSEAVRPQRSMPFELELPDPSDIDVVDVPTRLFANSLRVGIDATSPPLLTDVAGWAGADVKVVGFTRSTS